MEPEWKHEYSARETYADPADPLDPEDPLSPAFWHRTVERMKEDRELFKTYLQYESKLSEEAKPCHKGSACEYEALCQMQASTVVQHQQCTEDAETLKGTKNKKKPNKKKPFSVTRAGKEVIVGDYDEERGYIEGLGVERREGDIGDINTVSAQSAIGGTDTTRVQPHHGQHKSSKGTQHKQGGAY
ncbi:hypothetical protein BX616_000203 [Lobosporangium transversale]|nr:hypothetical protein BX616_000203 [Lobosporangium transversale]